jgi:hypothetical protein
MNPNVSRTAARPTSRPCRTKSDVIVRVAQRTASIVMTKAAGAAT